jgi:hypothetical protein
VRNPGGLAARIICAHDTNLILAEQAGAECSPVIDAAPMRVPSSEASQWRVSSLGRGVLAQIAWAVSKE